MNNYRSFIMSSDWVFPHQTFQLTEVKKPTKLNNSKTRTTKTNLQ